jgi:Squalene-hopene cyclase C-terminal domain
LSAAVDFLARLCGRAAPALPPAARAIAAADRRGAGSYPDPGPDRLVAECLAWLERAQNASSSADGGVARHYSAISGWAPSYPETTGYLVPTLLACAERTGRQDLVDRARRMLDWLVAIQFPEGAYQGGVIGAAPRLPVVFNTGQILLGLAAGACNLGGYRDALHRAADWLVSVQDADGCWRRHASPFALAGEKTYDTHVAWGLIEAERILSGRGYGEAALANIRWALTRQQANGWFADCCLTDPRRPLTHTLGYALRGVVEGYRFSGEAGLLAAARRTADGLVSALRPDGWLPGRLDARWRAAADWVCLTGSSQVAHCWLQLYQITGAKRYRDAAQRANRWVRRTVLLDGPAEQRGGVKGSFPFDGGYGRFEFLNWAVKFTIDANLLEQQLETRQGTSSGQL